MRNCTFGFALAACSVLVTGCNGSGDSTSSSSQGSQSISVQSSSSTSTSIQLNPDAPAAPGIACPWGLRDTRTFSDYQQIGVEISLDCQSLGRKVDSYSQEDLNKSLAALDEALTAVRANAAKPKHIAIGEHPYHSVRGSLIEVPLGGQIFSVQATPRYLEVSMRLLVEEASSFGGQVRLSFAKVRKVRRADGTFQDVGSDSFSTPTAAELDQALATVRRYRHEIQNNRARFPDVVLERDNSLPLYTANLEDQFYELPTAPTDAEGQAFFRYLGELGVAAGKIAPAQLNVDTYRSDSLAVDFAKAKEVLALTERLADMVHAQPAIKALHIHPRAFSAGPMTDEKFTVSFSNGRLMISGLVNFFGEVVSADAIRSCMAGKDFHQEFSVLCRPR